MILIDSAHSFQRLATARIFFSQCKTRNMSKSSGITGDNVSKMLEAKSANIESIVVPKSSQNVTTDLIRDVEIREFKNSKLLVESKPASVTSPQNLKVQSGNKIISDTSQAHLKPDLKSEAVPITHSEHLQILAQSPVIAQPKQIPYLDQDQSSTRPSLPFSDVPGPWFLKIVSKLWNVLPKAGVQLTTRSMNYIGNVLQTNLKGNASTMPFEYMFRKYGSIVKLSSPLGGDLVIIHHPEHVSSIYNQEGQYPVRSGFDSLNKYRNKHLEMQATGIFNVSGYEWENIRQKVEMSFQLLVANSYSGLGKICDDFVQRIAVLRNAQLEVPSEFYTEIYKWAVECVALITLNQRMGCLHIAGLKPLSEGHTLFESLISASDSVRRCESGLQMWRFFETPSWRKLTSSCEAIDTVIQNQIQKVVDSLDSSGKPEEGSTSLIHTLLLNDALTSEEILTVILDILLIGVNTTSHALSFLLYHLADNQRAQNCLYKELRNIMPAKDSDFSLRDLTQMSYLNACLKESLRLDPPMPTTTRVLHSDIELNGYRIPKGTYVLMTNHVSSRSERNFEDADRFKPERWLSNEYYTHPFSTIPFGHGPRSCLGREISEIQLGLAVAKIVRSFQIEYHYQKICGTNKWISKPNRPLKFTFKERND